VAPSCDDDDDGKEYLLFLIFLKKTEKKTLKAKVCERRNTKKQLTILFSLFNPPLLKNNELKEYYRIRKTQYS